jgi:hypothetical protein
LYVHPGRVSVQKQFQDTVNLGNKVRDNPDRNMKSEKFSSQLSTCFKRHMGFRSKRTFQTVFRAAGETETTQKIIQDWLELVEGDPGFQLLVFL